MYNVAGVPGVSDEVDQVLGNVVHVSSVVSQGSMRCEWRCQPTAEEVPVWTIFIDHANVVVVLRSQIPVDHVSFIGRTQRIL